MEPLIQAALAGENERMAPQERILVPLLQGGERMAPQVRIMHPYTSLICLNQEIQGVNHFHIEFRRENDQNFRISKYCNLRHLTALE